MAGVKFTGESTVTTYERGKRVVFESKGSLFFAPLQLVLAAFAIRSRSFKVEPNPNPFSEPMTTVASTARLSARSAVVAFLRSAPTLCSRCGVFCP